MKKTILIFGVSSFVGSNLAKLLSDEYRIIGTYYKNPVTIPGITCVPCDILKKDYISKLIAIFKPHYSIYAVGMSSLTDCNHNPKKADALNSAGAANCAGSSERYGSKFIYISSGFVLGGDDLFYKESDTPFPTTVYGSSLLSAEFYIQRSCLNYLILRCAPIFGRSSNPFFPNWFEYLQTSLSQNQTFMADNLVQTGFIDVYSLSQIIKNLLRVITGNKLLHISSQDFMTRYEFAKNYAKVFKKDQGLIQPSNGNFPVDNTKRSAEKASTNNHYFKLDTSNLESLIGEKMPTIEESLILTYNKLSTSLSR
jgi:dTDP-4-dehydrorhamnose reductase